MLASDNRGRKRTRQKLSWLSIGPGSLTCIEFTIPTAGFRAWPEGGTDAEEEGFVETVNVVQKSVPLFGVFVPAGKPF